MGGADVLDVLCEMDPEVSGLMVSGLELFLQYGHLWPSKEEMGGGSLINFSSDEGFCGINHCASLTWAFHTSCVPSALKQRMGQMTHLAFAPHMNAACMARMRSQRQYPSTEYGTE